MANIKKSFNFRNGVQVDDDNFIVNPNGLVGIGSTIPTESLDVLGNVRVRGSLLVDSIQADSIVNTSETGSVSFNLVNVGITSITSGIVSATSGIVTYYGDARYLQGMPTSQWVDVDPGLGYTSIYAAGNVGIATTNPFYTFQVGIRTGGVGITSEGDVIIGRDLYVSGIATVNTNLNVTGITTSYSFSGFGTNITGINASNISNGTLDNARIPSNINKTSGIATFSAFYGNLVGIATTARNLTTDANIDIVSIVSDYSNLGIATASTFNATTSIGIGTLNPNSDFHLRKTSNATLEVTSDTNEAKIIIGNEVNTGSFDSFGILKFGNIDINQNLESTNQSFDIINYAPGNLNYYIRPESTPNLKFNWINYSTNTILASLTSLGKLGIGKTNPSETFEVVGTSTITSTSYFGSNVYISGTLYPSSLTVSGTSIFNSSVGIGTNSSSHDFQVGANPNNSIGLSISRDGNLRASGIITASSFVGSGSNLTNINPTNISSGTITSNLSINSSSGIITASSFVGSGSNLTNINPTNISSGTITSNLSINSSSGIITASSFVGSGSNLTNINPTNISSGTINSSIDINSPVGIITASSFVGSGSNLTNINPTNISSGTITSNLSINSSSGIITAFSIDASLNASKITSGQIPSDITFSSTIGIGTTSVYDDEQLQIKSYAITVGVTTDSITSGVTTSIDYFYNDDYSSVEYFVSLNLNSNYQTEKILIMNDSSNAFSTSYAVLFNPNRIVTFSVNVNQDQTPGRNQVNLNILPESGMTGILTYRLVRNSILSWDPTN
jgi:hypothetical protein